MSVYYARNPIKAWQKEADRKIQEQYEEIRTLQDEMWEKFHPDVYDAMMDRWMHEAAPHRPPLFGFEPRPQDVLPKELLPYERGLVQQSRRKSRLRFDAAWRLRQRMDRVNKAAENLDVRGIFWGEKVPAPVYRPYEETLKGCRGFLERLRKRFSDRPLWMRCRDRKILKRRQMALNKILPLKQEIKSRRKNAKVLWEQGDEVASLHEMARMDEISKELDQLMRAEALIRAKEKPLTRPARRATERRVQFNPVLKIDPAAQDVDRHFDLKEFRKEGILSEPDPLEKLMIKTYRVFLDDDPNPD